MKVELRLAQTSRLGARAPTPGSVILLSDAGEILAERYVGGDVPIPVELEVERTGFACWLELVTPAGDVYRGPIAIARQVVAGVDTASVEIEVVP